MRTSMWRAAVQLAVVAVCCGLTAADLEANAVATAADRNQRVKVLVSDALDKGKSEADLRNALYTEFPAYIWAAFLGQDYYAGAAVRDDCNGRPDLCNEQGALTDGGWRGESELIRWSVFWTLATEPVIGFMKEGKTVLNWQANRCFNENRAKTSTSMAKCIVEEMKLPAIFVVTGGGSTGDFAANSLVVVDASSGDAHYRIMALMPRSWYRPIG